MSPLRSRLRRLLALSLATPVATAAACRAGTSAPTVPADAASAGEGDAALDATKDAGLADDSGVCAPVPVEAGLFGEDGSCGRFVQLPCGIPPALQGVGCYPSIDFCTMACPEGAFFACAVPPPTCEDGGLVPGAPVYVDCATCLVGGGRRPVGLPSPKRSDASSPVARYFEDVAYVERASVDAFVQLHARLTSFAAPPRLRRAALRAVGDERRHARVTAGFARRYGGKAESPRPCALAPLTFEEWALENAVEGCVRETFAALVAMHQAERASDPRVARAMRLIAEDETRHAELAWAIHRWAAPRLSAEARRRVRAAQAQAVAELGAGAGGWGADVGRVVGLPDGATEARLARDFGHVFLGVGANGSGRCRGIRRPNAARHDAAKSAHFGA
jgi:hypothetical protein